MRRKHGRNDGGQLMECLELDSSHFFVDSDAIDSPLDIHLEFNSLTVAKAVPDHSRYSQSGCSNVPDPPPLPGTSYGAQRSSRNAKACSRVLEEVLDSGDKLFQEGYQADLRVLADGGSEILSHSCVLGVKSPVLRAMLEEAKLKHGLPCIRIPGAPSEAVRVFIRFLYSSRFEQEQMKKHVLHLFLLSHVFLVPSLKTVCIEQLERNFLAPDNVVDMLQLARLCDAPRLSVICTRMIVADFKTISLSDGWKVMRQANPSLEQELLESLVEADTKRQERAERIEENKVYLQLYEAMEALVHICRDGCRTIGPRDQALKGSGAAVCKFPACRGIELLVRHFSACRVRVPGGCGNCKRMWQLLELHSRMCFTPDTCKVPLCRHFKEKMQHLGRKEETKWNLLACKVLESRGTMSSISERRNLSTVKPTDSCRMVPI
ncbi:BTB/POZ and TAZ domain-containing protein 3 isoform X2 [Phragmites australis]|uniref:BTB/POZ and TAZ domain-containing protein 3 isoform X2 n=1 Tax=Phragmites australis TaxID=29695 RepID=UPI002D76F837|nr:BTB/POZ and TAZ domain-containing protein 3 isoform X2 [Phragmites australis]